MALIGWWPKRRCNSACRSASSCRCLARCNEEDFTAESREQFARLCDAAAEIFELPLLPGSTPRSIVEPGPGRTRQYAQVGVFLSAHCHVLLAVWDGKDSELLGGTAATVRFHHHDVMPGYTPRVTSSKLNLTEDESDLVYHVVCSRDRPDGAPAAGFKPYETSWFTTDENNPRTQRFRPGTARFSSTPTSSAARPQNNAAAIDKERYSLLTGEQASTLPAGPLGHQPGVLRGGLAGDPLPEESRERR